MQKNQKLCSHFISIKKEKLMNFLNNPQNFNKCFYQQQKKSHQTVYDKNRMCICLLCEKIFCNSQSLDKCIEQHSYEKYNKQNQQNHMIFDFENLSFYCSTCKKYLADFFQFDYQINESQLKNGKKQQEIMNFVEEMADIILTKIQKMMPKQNQKSIQEEEKQQDLKQQQQQKVDFLQLQKVFGLKNIGNTCFFNSILQCLNGCENYINIYLNTNFENKTRQENLQQSQIDDEGWITVSKKQKLPRQSKNQSKNSLQQRNLCAAFQKFVQEARCSTNSSYNPQELHKSISFLYKRFRGFGQQDAQEFLRLLLDGLSTQEEKIIRQQNLGSFEKQKCKQKISYVEKEFGFYLCNIIKCLNCNAPQKQTYDFCLDLILSIPIIQKIKKNNNEILNSIPNINKNLVITSSDINKEEQNLIQEFNQMSVNEDNAEMEEQDIQNQQVQQYNEICDIDQKNVQIPSFPENYILIEPSISLRTCKKNLENTMQYQITLEDCLNEFSHKESLSDTKNNNYKCESCQSFNNIERKFFFYDPPETLTIMLKRFIQRKIGGIFSKNNVYIDFPFNFSLDPYTLFKVKHNQAQNFFQSKQNYQEYQYELFGVVVHSGSMSGGHYISYVKHKYLDQEQWIYYSDNQFKEVSENQVKQAQAYILFYKKLVKK